MEVIFRLILIEYTEATKNKKLFLKVYIKQHQNLVSQPVKIRNKCLFFYSLFSNN